MARLPNVPTVWSNVFTAWVLAPWFPQAKEHWHGLIWILAGGMFVYMGGAIFSEVCDVKFDRQFRPERPLPEGRVSRWMAGLAGIFFGVLGVGMMIAAPSDGRLALPMSAVLIVIVYSYAAFHKISPWFAVPLMALCRPMLVCIVLSLNMWLPPHYDDVFFTGPNGFGLAYMIALGLYVGGISWVALGEARVWRRKAVGMMLACLPLLDAIFLVCGGHAMQLVVPLACMVLAIGLRKVAAAT